MVKWIRGWISTIRLMFDKQLREDLKAAQKEFKNGETVKWLPSDDRTK